MTKNDISVVDRWVDMDKVFEQMQEWCTEEPRKGSRRRLERSKGRKVVGRSWTSQTPRDSRTQVTHLAVQESGESGRTSADMPRNANRPPT